MNPATTDALLKWLLRLVGGVELFAIPFIVIPVAWMDAVNDRVLGLGPLPNSPITEYLTRTLSAMYALHGAVVLRVTLGLTVLGIGLSAGLPWWWVAGEGPGIIVGGLLVLVLSWMGARGGRGVEDQLR